MTTLPFIPSSSALDGMIQRAMRKCDGDVEQARLRHEAREEERMARAISAETAQRNRRFWFER